MTKRHAKIMQPYAIVYLRVSSELQENIQDQLPGCQERAAAMGLPIPPDGVYTDEALSRDRFLTRPGLQAMLRRAQDPNCQVVIVNWFNRLYTTDNQKEIFAALRQAGVRLFDAAGLERNTGSHDGEVVDFLDAWMAKGQVVFIRQSVHDTHRAKAMTGRFVGKPPYGVEVVPVFSLPCQGKCGPARGADCPVVHGVISSKNGTVWVMNAEKMLVLGAIYAWLGEGMSISQLRKRCIEHGYGPQVKVTKRGDNKGRIYGGNPWSKANLIKLASNEFYKGTMIYGRLHTHHDGDRVWRETTDPSTWIIKDHVFGEIVPESLWERANTNIRLRANTKSGEDRTHPVQVWDGFVWCGRCSWKMHPHPRTVTKKSGQQYDYYCDSKTSEYSICRSGQSVPLHWLMGLLRGDGPPRGNTEVVLELDERPDAGPELALLREALSAIPDQLNRVKALATTTSFYDTADEAVAAKQEILERQSELNRRMQELLAAPTGAVIVDTLPSAAMDFFDLALDERLPVEKRQAELATVLVKVLIDRPKIRFILRKDFLESAS